VAFRQTGANVDSATRWTATRRLPERSLGLSDPPRVTKVHVQVCPGDRTEGMCPLQPRSWTCHDANAVREVTLLREMWLRFPTMRARCSLQNDTQRGHRGARVVQEFDSSARLKPQALGELPADLRQ